MENAIKIPGIGNRIIIKKISKNHLAIVKDRKSRIIRKDAEKILENINIIKNERPEVKISFMTSAPLCSKAIAFLDENSIEILEFKE
jgi:hypothetical protein